MKKFAGILLVVVVAVVVFIFTRMSPSGPGITVKGFIGGEKVGLLKDPEIVKLLRRKYGITVDAQKAGSIEMVEGDSTGKDFLWPSSQVASEIYKLKHGGTAKTEVIFNSPIVLYSWEMIVGPLTSQKLVEKRGGIYYVDLPKLVTLAESDKAWKDLGLPKLYGTLTIHSTDPTKSNSGNMFAGLLSTILNNGKMVDSSTIATVLPKVKSFFTKQGRMEESSGDLFEQFLKEGEGANPIVVGYENQLIEFGLENDQYMDVIKNRVRILYPTPTVWSSHPLIVLSDKGQKLLDALKDPEVQKLAWTRHGFRSGMMGAQNDPKVLSVIGIPTAIETVVPMPPAEIMLKIIEALQQ